MKLSNKPKDFPFDEIAATCERLIESGAFIIQKWTCEKCGRRLTGTNVNALHVSAKCLHCMHVTDIKRRGCNYTLIRASDPETTAADVERMLNLKERFQ